MRGRAAGLVMLLWFATSLHAQDLRKLVTFTTPGRVADISVCGSSGLAAGRTATGAVYLWQLPSGEMVTSQPAESGVSAVACSPDGKWLAIGKGDGSVTVGEVAGKSAKTLAATGQRINELAFSADGSVLAARVAGAPVRLLNPALGTQLAILKTDFGSSAGMAFSPDSSLFATVDGDTAVRIYDRNGNLKVKYSGFLLEPFAIAFIDNKQIVVGGADGMLTILDVSDAHVVRQFAKQPDPTFAVAALPDGKSLCSLQIDAMSLKKYTALLWDIKSGSKRELPVDGSHLVGFGTSPAHKGMLLTADSDSAVTAWEFQN
ncbi:MAG: WD40 repeat domain-containing protein [Candidatus Sulfotelmatobacter sp.]